MGFFRAIGRGLKKVGRGIKKAVTTKAGLLAIGAGAALAFVPGAAPAVLKGLSTSAKALVTAGKATARGLRKLKGPTQELLQGLAVPQAEYTPPFLPEEEIVEEEPYTFEEDAAYYDPSVLMEATPPDLLEEPQYEDLLIVEWDGQLFLFDPRTNEALLITDEQNGNGREVQVSGGMWGNGNGNGNGRRY